MASLRCCICPRCEGTGKELDNFSIVPDWWNSTSSQVRYQSMLDPRQRSNSGKLVTSEVCRECRGHMTVLRGSTQSVVNKVIS